VLRGLSSIYSQLVDYLTAPHPSLGREFRQAVESHCLVCAVTCFFMWAYTSLAFFTIDHPLPWVLGLILTVIYTLTPFLYRFFPHVSLLSTLMISSAFLLQTVVGYYTGGFSSNTILWYGILPFLGAIILGKQGIILWLGVTTLSTFFFYLGHLLHYPFPNKISALGQTTSQVLIAFGWILLSAVVSYIHVHRHELSQRRLSAQKHHVESLFRVLIHDLLNPISLIQSNLVLVKQTNDDEVKANAVQRIQKSSESLAEITQNMKRIYSEEKSEPSILDCKLVLLNPLISKLEQLHASQLQEKKLNLCYDFEGLRGVKVWVDPLSFLHQVLSNVLSNAIKFSHPKGHILITATLLDEETIAVQFVDQGIGVPPELLSQLTEYKGLPPTRLGTQGEGGTGLGLTLVKTFTEKYGGKVSIASEIEPGRSGTKVTLELKTRPA
jgi:signal transduction histidine kinase